MDCDECGKPFKRKEEVAGHMFTRWTGGSIVHYDEAFYHAECYEKARGFKPEELKKIGVWRTIFKQKRREQGHTFRHGL